MKFIRVSGFLECDEEETTFDLFSTININAEKINYYVSGQYKENKKIWNILILLDNISLNLYYKDEGIYEKNLQTIEKALNQ